MNNEFKDFMAVMKENGEMRGRIEAVKAYVSHSKYSVDNEIILAMLGAVTDTMITREIERLKKAMEDIGVCVAVGDLEDGILDAIFGNTKADDEKAEEAQINKSKDSCEGDCDTCDCEDSCYECKNLATVEATCDCKPPRGCEDCCPDEN